MRFPLSHATAVAAAGPLRETHVLVTVWVVQDDEAVELEREACL